MYRKKYLKYKIKYLKLQQYGGNNTYTITDTYSLNNVPETTISLILGDTFNESLYKLSLPNLEKLTLGAEYSNLLPEHLLKNLSELTLNDAYTTLLKINLSNFPKLKKIYLNNSSKNKLNLDITGEPIIGLKIESKQSIQSYGFQDYINLNTNPINTDHFFAKSIRFDVPENRGYCITLLGKRTNYNIQSEKIISFWNFSTYTFEHDEKFDGSKESLLYYKK